MDKPVVLYGRLSPETGPPDIGRERAIHPGDRRFQMQPPADCVGIVLKAHPVDTLQTIDRGASLLYRESRIRVLVLRSGIFLPKPRTKSHHDPVPALFIIICRQPRTSFAWENLRYHTQFDAGYAAKQDADQPARLALGQAVSLTFLQSRNILSCTELHILKLLKSAIISDNLRIIIKITTLRANQHCRQFTPLPILLLRGLPNGSK